MRKNEAVKVTRKFGEKPFAKLLERLIREELALRSDAVVKEQ